MEERRRRISSLVEWAAAALGVMALVWIVSVPLQRSLGRRGEAAVAQVNTAAPPGVPAAATNVPVMLLLDGREIRVGDLRARLDEVLPPQLADGPPHVSRAQFGDRHSRAFIVDGARFYVVCERTEPNGAMRVSGIYLP